ncbi:hypothetical protein Ancab_034502 [Ancistrocladus abbreviatus]
MDNRGGEQFPTRPLHRQPYTPTSTLGVGGREDCWSEGATAALIEAWGERHLRCNRGNLRQNDWKEVADAVNSRESGAKSRRTDIQCKNRIDTLKKKYKIEKAKPSPSNWPFFPRMDYLIGPNNSGGKKLSPVPAVTFTVKQSNKFGFNSNPNPNTILAANSNRKGNWTGPFGGSSSKLNSMAEESSESSMRGGEPDDDEDLLLVGDGGGGGRKHRMDYVDSSEEETAFRELARAILKFGEIYERIESSKQEQMMELEKQRMEFAKELEFQRLNMLMEAQIELQKLKRHKNAATAGKKLPL